MAAHNSKQLPGRAKDETGNVYGKLTVVGYAGSRLKALPGSYWHCLCDCGNVTVVAGRALRNGGIRSCGCQQRTDEIGNVYGKLTVVAFAETRRGLAYWLCHCDCGNTTTVAGSGLRKGTTKSCGCHRARADGACGHGHRTPEYTTWREMIRRCYKPRTPYYHIYGGRGITVCDRWRTSFVNFLADMGHKPFPEATIDRIDGNGNYEASNCRWASKLEQGQNTSKAKMLTYNGETMCLRAWARKLGITHRTLMVRIERGWPPEKVFSTEHYFTPPPKKRPKQAR